MFTIGAQVNIGRFIQFYFPSLFKFSGHNAIEWFARPFKSYPHGFDVACWKEHLRRADYLSKGVFMSRCIHSCTSSESHVIITEASCIFSKSFIEFKCSSCQAEISSLVILLFSATLLYLKKIQQNPNLPNFCSYLN